ncbi:MAG: DHH family phosphoesterase [Candidatus Diapherotrites archaeon]|uniref:DHH family phosphoesterase n=1 Tax=Candidatus Iainarchaeum sp. TaxID=3101447 RepID=A0A8T4LG01_9ARCH|nr:DHH family phosphoesterase [Candidatus Diapherotrites archaeon]
MALESFVKKLSKSTRLLLLCHAGTDVDSLASAIALKETLSCNCTVGFPDHMGLHALQLADRFGIKAVKDPVLDRFDALALLDFNSPSHAGKLSKSISSFNGPVLILDHHLPEADRPKKAFVEIDSNRLSASQVVLSEIRKAKLKLSKKALQALAAGILSDTAMLSVLDTHVLDDLSFCLKESRSDVESIKRLVVIQEPVSERIAKLRSASRMRLFEVDGFLVALSTVNFFESEAAASLVALGCDVALVAGIDHGSNALVVSARSSSGFVKDSKVSLVAVMQGLVPAFGGHGNGHVAAAGFNSFHSNTEDVLHRALELLVFELKQKKKSVEVREII